MKNTNGFSLIELMVVVAVIGILSAIAFPIYQKYIAASRQTASISNCNEAQKFIKSELSKRSAGSAVTTDAFAVLNADGKKSPYDSNQDAFDTVMAAGVVTISASDLNGAPTGSTITVSCDWTGDGVADSTSPIQVE